MSSKPLFIHIPKNAGLTVRSSLKNEIQPCTKKMLGQQYASRLLKTMNDDGEHHGIEHARWRDIPNAKNFRSFAIVRNPWTKVVSRFMYGIRGMERGRIEPNYMPKDFEEFLEERHKYGGKEFYWHRVIKGWFPQLDHIADTNGNIRCDVLRFEHFDEDITKYLKLKQPPKPRNSFHRGNKDPQWAKWDIDYNTLYTDKTIQIVADWYKDDIETFGFDFDTTATRNYWCE